MTDMTVPRDPRPQFSELAVMLANNARGRMPLDGVEKVGPDRYVVAGWWPQTVPARGSWASTNSGSSLAAPVPDAAPKSAATALALWPNLT
jgi:hypothetical protein